MKWVIMTAAGYAAAKQELKQLREKRPGAVSELQTARALGDLSENGAYRAARWRLSGIDRRLRQLERILKTARLPQTRSASTVQVGFSVTVVNDNNQAQEFHLVGDYEADPLNNKISYRSPVGRALLGQRVGETVSVDLPSGKFTYQIIKIKPS
ncbi:transcription elongation factor GreA [Patescibacteria group bacterium]|nr:transcription elongation factor GreA [Patescibacteria group bacterium]